MTYNDRYRINPNQTRPKWIVKLELLNILKNIDRTIYLYTHFKQVNTNKKSMFKN